MPCDFVILSNSLFIIKLNASHVLNMCLQPTYFHSHAISLSRSFVDIWNLFFMLSFLRMLETPRGNYSILKPINSYIHFHLSLLSILLTSFLSIFYIFMSTNFPLDWMNKNLHGLSIPSFSFFLLLFPTYVLNLPSFMLLALTPFSCLPFFPSIAVARSIENVT